MICAQSPLMSDPLRTDASRAHADVTSEPDRDGKIEQLLLVGLDHYFGARYELAINVWTRALFLDRSHARARAYIERARSALAERQRQSEELLQNGTAAFRRGDSGEARRLLQAAIESGAPLEDAFPILERLNRMDSVPASPPPARSQSDRPASAVPPAAESARRGRGLAWSIVTLIALVAVGAYAAIASSGDWRMLVGLQSVRSATLAPAARDAV